jgi:hypothetical protein
MLLRNLVLWFLLIPLPLNGLWMACDDRPAEEQAATGDSPALTQEQIDCIRICAMKHQAADESGGPICIILPGNSRTSITIINFGTAIVPAKIELSPIAVVEQHATTLPEKYSAPSLPGATPPPETM